VLAVPPCPTPGSRSNWLVVVLGMKERELLATAGMDALVSGVLRVR
jgi:hypothetical protein